MTTKSRATALATRKKLLEKVSAAEKLADAARKKAKGAKVLFRHAREKFKTAKREAKKIKKAVKKLKAEVAAIVLPKVRQKAAPKRKAIAPGKSRGTLAEISAPVAVPTPELEVAPAPVTIDPPAPETSENPPA